MGAATPLAPVDKAAPTESVVPTGKPTVAALVATFNPTTTTADRAGLFARVGGTAKADRASAPPQDNSSAAETVSTPSQAPPTAVLVEAPVAPLAPAKTVLAFAPADSASAVEAA